MIWLRGIGLQVPRAGGGCLGPLFRGIKWKLPHIPSVANWNEAENVPSFFVLTVAIRFTRTSQISRKRVLPPGAVRAIAGALWRRFLRRSKLNGRSLVALLSLALPPFWSKSGELRRLQGLRACAMMVWPYLLIEMRALREASNAFNEKEYSSNECHLHATLMEQRDSSKRG